MTHTRPASEAGHEDTTASLPEALRRPSAYGFDVERIELVQTSLSWLFMTDEQVFKVKKPVKRQFVDFSTLSRRHEACEAEVRLNRRLAPDDVYRGVTPITRSGDDERAPLRVDGGGEIVDYAVHMRRLSDHRMLDRLLERGEVDNAMMDALARTLARFHDEAPTGAGIDEHATPDAVRRKVEDVLRLLDRLVDAEASSDSAAAAAVLTDRQRRFLRRYLIGALDRGEELFRRRVETGRIREGHGDLHAGNICFEGEQPIIYDCIEFSRDLRCLDVASDLAFLTMDLDLRGFNAFGEYLVHEYVQRTGDRGLPGLIDFYKTYRACVRCMVHGLEAKQADDAQARAEATRAAMRYGALAVTYPLPPTLIATCGLPGTGKSVAARRIARPFGAAVLRSDVMRKRLAGRPPADHAAADPDEGIYRPGWTARTYEALRSAAVDMLQDDRSVVVDASFSRASRRAAFAQSARLLDRPFLLVEVECDEDVVRQRLRDREANGRDASDADAEVYEVMRRRFEPPNELDGHRRLTVHSPADGEAMTAAALDRLIAQVDEPCWPTMHR
ncbi:MAG: AAA family ATPase [Planctomycetota bacterium]|nr:AAA family ATPase [Planctomycetota bacterium]